MMMYVIELMIKQIISKTYY